MSVITLYYNDEGHTYRDSRGIEYTSASLIVSRYSDKFIAEECAINESFERGVSITEVIDRYKKAADTGISIGNEEHNFMESNFKEVFYGSSNTFEFNTERVFDEDYIVDFEALVESPLVKYKHFYDLVVMLALDGWVFYSEHKLFNPKYLVCGTSDLIAKKDDKVIIFDYKTCKDDIEFTSGYYSNIKFGGLRIKSKYRVNQYKKMMGVLNHLDDCNGIKYSIQLSVYGKLLELCGYKVVGCYLVHLKPVLDKDIVLDFNYKLLPLTYYKKEALKTFKENVDKYQLHQL